MDERFRVIVSPELAHFAPVTLSNSHEPVSEVPQTDSSSLQKIIEDSNNFLVALETQHRDHVAKYKNWLQDKKEKDRAEKQRLAPGYFDSSIQLLVPEPSKP